MRTSFEKDSFRLAFELSQLEINLTTQDAMRPSMPWEVRVFIAATLRRHTSYHIALLIF